jgi:hypothetical protein
VLGPRAGRELVGRYPATRLLVEDARMRPLFDGATLAGWTTSGGRYDGDARWSVEEGCIVGRAGPDGAGGLLYAAPPAPDFALELEVRIERPFDSGVFVRMRPPAEGDLKGAQVTLDDRPEGEIAAIYADGFLLHNEAAAAHWRAGEWNHLELRLTGLDFRIEAWLNGVLVTDYALPPGTPGFAPDGLIGLQVHEGARGEKGEVRFRDILGRRLGP